MRFCIKNKQIAIIDGNSQGMMNKKGGIVWKPEKKKGCLWERKKINGHEHSRFAAMSMTQRNQVNRTFAVLLNKERGFYRQAVDSLRVAQALSSCAVLSGKNKVVTPYVKKFVFTRGYAQCVKYIFKYENPIMICPFRFFRKWREIMERTIENTIWKKRPWFSLTYSRFKENNLPS